MNEVKTKMIGEAADLNKQLQILNRTVRWSSRRLSVEADLRQSKEVLRAQSFEGASPPGVHAAADTGQYGSTPPFPPISSDGDLSTETVNFV